LLFPPGGYQMSERGKQIISGFAAKLAPTQQNKILVSGYTDNAPNIATGQVEDRVEDDRDSAAAELGRKGGKARAERLTPEERREIAKKAARKRWGTPPIIAIRHSTEMAF
jgi:flagellar motor protein MotB